MGHVNNAVYFTYLESARTRFFFEKLSLSDVTQLPLILAEASCSYKSPARFGDHLTVGLAIGRIGGKSFDILYQITAGSGRLVAEAKTIMVTFDYEKGETIPIPDNLNKLLQSYLITPQVPDKRL
jgi:acyl-CoA thioester hydrolase